ncbi:MAG TPA: VanZ family protein [Gemmatimonadaceae bacterium]|nr:VanZ family protein [Gemmatimonadaceae bacterium]
MIDESRGTSPRRARSTTPTADALAETHTSKWDVALIPHRTLGRLLAALGFAFIAIMTLTPQAGPPAFAPSLCILCGELAVQDIILNVILFVPFGAGLRLAGVRRTRVIALAFCLTAAIELLQMHIIPGRDSSLGDVITNTLGGAIGVALADSWRVWLEPTAQQARRQLWGGVVVWITIFAATVWALHRALPESTVWGQWDPAILHFDRFSGTIVKSDAAGFAFPPGARGSDRVFRRRLVSDSVLVSAQVVPGAPTERTAPILSVYDLERTQIFLLAQRQRALVFSIRMNTARAMVRDPIIGLDDVFPMAANARAQNDTLRVAGGVIGNALVIRATDDAHHTTRERRVTLGPGLGWSFFLPWPYAFGSETDALSAVWIGGLLLPLAYWARRARRPLEASAALGVAVLGGLVIAPLVFHGALAGWVEWAGVAFGLTLGAALGGGVTAPSAAHASRSASRVRQTPVAHT